MQTLTITSARTAFRSVLTAQLPFGTAIAGGVLTAMAWDPWGWAVAAIVGLSLWWFAVSNSASATRAWTASTIFGVIWLAVVCAWMCVFGPIPYLALVLIEGAVVGLVGMMGWFWRANPWRWLMVPACWVAIEAARTAFPFGGFAWAQLSHSQATGGWLLGYLPWLGSWGMSGVIVALGMGVVTWLNNPRDIRNWVYAVVLVAGGMVLRQWPAPFTAPASEALDVGYVQAGDVRHTFAAGISSLNPKNQRVIDAITNAHAVLSRHDLDLIVWPENSLDNDPDTPGNEWLAQARDRLLAQVGDATVFAGQNDHNEVGKLTNAIGVYHQGKRTGTITKQKLVPFGEFFPYPDLLSWVPSAQLIGHMVPGAGPDAMPVGDELVGAVICYESAYPSMIAQAIAKDAGLLVVSTNNASFGDSAMMHQHLSISRLRAVEYGRPVIHASLSGPSTFITPDGQLADAPSYLEPAARIQQMQPRHGFTPAAWLNPVLPWVAAALALMGLLVQLSGRVRAVGS